MTDQPVAYDQLQGKRNARQWKRHFKVAALAKGVWDVFTGVWQATSCPDYDDYGLGSVYDDATKADTSANERRRGRGTIGPEDVKAFMAEAKKSTEASAKGMDFQGRMALYKFTLDEYDRGRKILSTAMALLIVWVHPSLRGQLEKFDSPKEAYEYLVSRYDITDARARELAENQFSAIYITRYNTAQDYINAIENARQDIEEAGGHCDDQMMISKIIRGLRGHPIYKEFATQYHLLRDIDSKFEELDHVITQLLTYESSLAPEPDLRRATRPMYQDYKRGNAWETKNPYFTRSANYVQRNSNRENSQTRTQCTHCGNGGHVDTNCWRLHPELRPQRSANRRNPRDKINHMAAATMADKNFFSALAEAKSRGTHDHGNKQYPNPTSTHADALLQANALSETKQVVEGQIKGELVLPAHGHVTFMSSRKPTIGESSQTPFAFMTETARDVHPSSWILDSGANIYVCNDATKFTKFYSFETAVNTAGEDSSMNIAGGGTITLTLRDGDNEAFLLTLNDVAYAPSSRCNLLSVSKLARAGIHGDWDAQDRSMKLRSPDGLVIGTAHEKGGLYHLDLLSPVCSTKLVPMVANADFNDSVWKEHRRLGHLDLSRMLKLCDCSTGLQVTRGQIQAKLGQHCPICKISRATVHIPREPAQVRHSKKGELIHLDVWGPYSVTGLDGTRWMVFRTDDATRSTTTIRVKNLKDLPTLLRDAHKQDEKRYNIVIRRYRTDNAFKHGPWKDWCDKKGVTIELTAPYAHHQVGVAERVNRTLREGSSAMILDATVGGQVREIVQATGRELMKRTNLPEPLWPEAIDHAAWLKNRTPTRALKGNVTPWELEEGRRPDLSCERTWGSRVYVSYTAEEQGRKLHDPRGWLGYFVGCDNESTYRVWDPEKGKVRRVTYCSVIDGAGLDDPQNLAHNATRLNNATNLLQAPTVLVVRKGRRNALSPLEASSLLPGSEDETNELSPYFHHPDATAPETPRRPSQLHDSDIFDPSQAWDDYQQQFSTPPSRHKGPRNLTPRNLPKATQDPIPVAPRFYERPLTEHEDDSESLGEFNDVTSRIEELFTDADDEGPLLTDREPTLRPPLPVRDSGRTYANQVPLLAHEDEVVVLPRKPKRPRMESQDEVPKANQCYNSGHPRAKYNGCQNPHCMTKQAAQGGVMKSGERLCRNCWRRFRAAKGFSDIEGWRIPVSKKAAVTAEASATSYRATPRMRQKKNPETETELDSDETDEGELGGKRNTEARILARTPDADKCHGCFHRSKNCVRQPGQKCNRCIRDQRGCKPLEKGPNGELPETRKWSTVPVRHDEKAPHERCMGCQVNHTFCDAVLPIRSENPCTTCRRRGQRCRPRSEVELRAEWRPCSTCNKALTAKKCNMQRPCDMCIVRASPKCGYISKDRQRRVQHLTNPVPAMEAAVIDRNKDRNRDFYDPDEPRCRRCVVRDLRGRLGEDRRTCDEDINKPCLGCVKKMNLILDTGSKTNGEGCAWCKRWTAPGKCESLRTIYWTLNDDKEVVKRDKDDLEAALRRWKALASRQRAQQPGIPVDQLMSSSDDESDNEFEDPYSEDARARTRERLRNVQLSNTYLTNFNRLHVHDEFYQGADDANYNLDNIHPTPPTTYHTPVVMTIAVPTRDVALLPDPQTFNEAMKSPDGADWEKAIQDEYNSLMENNTWEVTTLPPGRKALTTKWVLKKKLGPTGALLKYKARMVARGFQQVEGYDYTETYSGVVKAAAYRLLFALIVLSGWTVHQMDVVTAFLNGDVLEEIYIQPPQGYPHPGKVLRLLKALYGLKQSPRMWYRRLKQWLVDHGWIVSKYDECVFYHPHKQLIMTVYVDDINIFGPNDALIEPFKKEMAGAFKMTDAGRASWYLGMQLQWLPTGLHIHQSGFIQQALGRYGLIGSKPASIPLDPTKKLVAETTTKAEPKFRTTFMSLVGSLNYLQTKTVWSLAFPVSLVSRFMANPNQAHFDAAVQLLRYVAGTSTKGLYMRKDGDPTIRGFVDSDWGGDSDTGKSTTGWVFTLAGSPISWSSHRQKTVSSSSTEAEYIAASDACKEAIWLKGFHNELAVILRREPQRAIPLSIDNASALRLTKNPEFHGRTKHINIRHHFIRECVERGEISPVWIPGKENPADLFTKALTRPLFQRCLGTLGEGCPPRDNQTTDLEPTVVRSPFFDVSSSSYLPVSSASHAS